MSALPCEACWWSPGCAFEEERVGVCAKFEHDGFYPLEEREKPTPGASGGSLSGGGCGAQEHRRGGVSGGWNKEDACSPTVAERTLCSDSKRSVPEDVSHQGERTSATPPDTRSCEPPEAPGVGFSRVEVTRSDACDHLSERCELCECWSRAIVHPEGSGHYWLRSCERGYACSSGMVCRYFGPADGHASGRWL